MSTLQFEINDITMMIGAVLCLTLLELVSINQCCVFAKDKI